MYSCCEPQQLAAVGGCLRRRRCGAATPHNRPQQPRRDGRATRGEQEEHGVDAVTASVKLSNVFPFFRSRQTRFLACCVWSTASTSTDTPPRRARSSCLFARCRERHRALTGSATPSKRFTLRLWWRVSTLSVRFDAQHLVSRLTSILQSTTAVHWRVPTLSAQQTASQTHQRLARRQATRLAAGRPG